MKSWYSKQLGEGMMASMTTAEIEKIFLALFEFAGKPVDMAVFTRHEPGGRPHCEVTAYFSPAAAEVAKVFDAKRCTKPSRGEVSLLAGDKRVWPVRFPD